MLAHHETTVALTAERAFLAKLDGSCRTPIAAHATLGGDGTVALHGVILTPDGKGMHETHQTGDADGAAEIGRWAGETVLAAAGPHFFDGWGQ